MGFTYMCATSFHICKSREIKDDQGRSIKREARGVMPTAQIFVSLSSYLVFTRETDHPSVSISSRASLCKVHRKAECINFYLTSFEHASFEIYQLTCQLIFLHLLTSYILFPHLFSFANKLTYKREIKRNIKKLLTKIMLKFFKFFNYFLIIK